jgi:anti-sigma B factor antagonist
MAARTPGVVIRRTRLQGAPVVAVSGELDLSTVQRLEEALDAAVRETEGTLLLDFSQVSFMDSSGVSVLLRARALLGREDRAVAVICPPGHVRDVFGLAGIEDLFTLFDTREAAAGALR